jgi:hypothetical protein
MFLETLKAIFLSFHPNRLSGAAIMGFLTSRSLGQQKALRD